MFSWFKKRPTPPSKSPANPGATLAAEFMVTENDGTSSTFVVDLVDLLARVLQDHNRRHRRYPNWIELGSGLILQPGYVSFGPANANQIHTVTTIETSHSRSIPAGIFEYQHGFGRSPVEAMAAGFEGWVNTDLAVFEDALRSKPVSCASLEIPYPASADRCALKRRVILGPVDHRATRELDPAVAEEHPFCTCCMFTRLMELLKERTESQSTFGIRFFASRANGTAKADCRINGVDWPEGVEALKAYVEQWPDRGLEFRKQYVLIHTAP